MLSAIAATLTGPSPKTSTQLGSCSWPPFPDPNTTQVTIHADRGTAFADYYGTNNVVASRASFFRPNNIVNNSSRGGLAWTSYPPYDLNCAPNSKRH